MRYSNVAYTFVRILYFTFDSYVFCSTFRSRNNDDMRKKSCKKQRGLAVNGCISCTCIRFGIVSYGCCNALDRRGNSQYTSDVHFPRNGRERDAKCLAVSFVAQVL